MLLCGNSSCALGVCEQIEKEISGYGTDLPDIWDKAFQNVADESNAGYSDEQITIYRHGNDSTLTDSHSDLVRVIHAQANIPESECQCPKPKMGKNDRADGSSL
jgi:hypothetical protein